MSTYTLELQDEIDRVTLKGNADKQTIRRLASIIFRMDQRILALEGVGETLVAAPQAAPVPTPEVVQKRTISPPKGPKSAPDEVKIDQSPEV